jgi:hypothetical protein
MTISLLFFLYYQTKHKITFSALLRSFSLLPLSFYNQTHFICLDFSFFIFVVVPRAFEQVIMARGVSVLSSILHLFLVISLSCLFSFDK